MSQITNDRIYETDFYQWTIEQAQALREQNFQELDWENIIEEIEALGRSDYSAVASLLMREIEHRLKIDYANRPECDRHWRSEMVAFRKNIKRRLSPSMKPKLQKDFSEIYQDAVEIVLAKYDLNLPTTCPYNLEDLLP
ncbi:conserved hypothetical protein [Microcystis aeruginosa PCC 9432]|jgi:hypothetical protein|uniref:DUF29 domain-containing protein n=3 Tax=Microcystis aeruginosa TaxID=1126 RepID=S3IYA1_MICAE|nr:MULTISPECIES: DUF29 domain-containing protein [Microcystis]NCR99950.1 DUF29 domain-containing protein [Microcystis aeruginosa L311-01]OCY11851.1 MAG: hypothetical protein BEV12_12620 [Microcystis aeruginosa CACIAM 03]TRT92326.1 MAG: DUF29 domain-containing protein [Microcystis aeruginosa Ma_OC_LR_19540900_S633]TRU12073.1 MAG: DUF29 domain-containing protein [Microcystis aeruginosa Ma_MB_F_20061100_S19D]TRU14811.1 MAG: DUF29 domain-containing protein [Microcystis aeruginosa Ma_MB_F_20061100_